MDTDEAKIGNHKNGRPSNHESAKINKIIQGYYLQGASPAYTIQMTGLNKNTVYAKFKEFDDLAKESNSKDFLEAHEAKKAQFIASIEDLIFRTYAILNYIEQRLEKYRRKNHDPPEFLLQKFSELTKNLLNMQKEKAIKSMKLPLDKELENKITAEVENVNN